VTERMGSVKSQPRRRAIARSVSVLAALLLAVIAIGMLAAGCSEHSSAQDSTVPSTSSMASSPSTSAVATPGTAQSGGPVTSAAADPASTQSTDSAGASTTATTAGAITTASTGAVTTSTTTTASGTATTGSEAKIFGKVLDSDGSPVAGATVRVVYDAADKGYRASGDNVIGSATTNAQGGYEVLVGSLPQGSIVDISVRAQDHTSVLVYGPYDETEEQVDFVNFGKNGGDRRMPVGDQMPPLPFEGLLPD